MCTTGVTTLSPPTVDDSNVETLVKAESRNYFMMLSWNLWCLTIFCFLDMNSSSSNTSLFFIALCLSLIVMSSVWVLYAYLNPHTRSGQMLIRVSNL